MRKNTKPGNDAYFHDAGAITTSIDNRSVGEDHVEADLAMEIHTRRDDVEAELFQWWMQTAAADFFATVPKMLEYGGTGSGPAVDLQLIGENLASLLDMHDASDAVKMELGCWFYMQGKIARLVSDYKHKRPGKPDTWFDSTIYGMMARRIQDTGQWP